MKPTPQESTLGKAAGQTVPPRRFGKKEFLASSLCRTLSQNSGEDSPLQVFYV